MEVLIIQAIALLMIILIGYIIFRYFPLEVNIKDITITAFLIMLSLVLSAFSMQIPLFGAMSLKIGFSQLPLMLMGAIMGPAWAFIGGLTQDILDVLINPSGFPFLGFTLNKVLIAIIPAIWFSKWNKMNTKQVYRLVYILIFMILVLTMVGIIASESLNVNDSVIMITSDIKILLSLACLSILTLLIFIINYFKKRYTEKNSRYHMANWLVAVLAIEICIQLILTPLWLDVMYGIPYIMNVLVRMMKASFMIFLNATIGHYLLNVIIKIRKGNNGTV
ncbi:MAG: folate family ECF transporter S component [Erysipelotrichaceae bacterium]|nr:folate family ECF transporter S component [Erysipelotrichaceae bacterium]MDD3924595.1 folate family ECF transporter S component [Erysipelotrichaceae bacterium]